MQIISEIRLRNLWYRLIVAAVEDLITVPHIRPELRNTGAHILPSGACQVPIATVIFGFLIVPPSPMSALHNPLPSVPHWNQWRSKSRFSIYHQCGSRLSRHRYKLNCHHRYKLNCYLYFTATLTVSGSGSRRTESMQIWTLKISPETHITRKATRHDCMPSLLSDGDQ